MPLLCCVDGCSSSHNTHCAVSSAAQIWCPEHWLLTVSGGIVFDYSNILAMMGSSSPSSNVHSPQCWSKQCCSDGCCTCILADEACE